MVLESPEVSTLPRTDFKATAVTGLAAYAYGPVIPSLTTSLTALFAETVSHYPDRPAVCWNGQSTTYRQLADLSDGVAAGLRARGVGPGSFVGLLVPKSVELYAGMLGILKAGAAYVPLDPSFPADRMAYILTDCQAAALLTDAHFSTPLPDWTGPIVDVAELLASPAVSYPETLPEPETIAYTIYTSGTTGRPKGVLVPHRAIGHLIQSERYLFAPTPADRVLQGFSVAFDASLEEIWLAFANGAALVPAPEATMKTPDALLAYLTDQEISVFSTVPTLLAMLEKPVPSVRLLILGGEVCPAELLQTWAGPNRSVVNTYGPTEATVIATACTYRTGHKLTIGKPIPNYTVWVMDENRRVLPPGESGEIVIGGPGVTAGYLNRPELTADKFITVTDQDVGESGLLYRTGDLGRYDADGELEFMGRIDTQVKLRGYRIELAEIEAQLLQYPGVRNAVVALKEANGAERLVAYVITENQAPVSTETVRTFLGTRLASYMLPAQVVVLPQFPLLTSGKVNRAELPFPVASDQPVTRQILLPRTDAETAIHRVFARHLAPEPVSVEDDFFELGGNSLLATLLINELRRDARYAFLSVKDLYTQRTVAQLAAYAGKHVAHAEPTAEEASAKKPSTLERFITAGLQLATLVSFYGLSVLAVDGVFRFRTALAHWAEWQLAGATLGIYLLAVPLYALLVVGIKWLLIGRYRAGTYPLWGFYYLRFWLVKKLMDTLPLVLLTGTPYLNGFYRLMGARIGRGVHLGSSRLVATDLIQIGAGTSVAKEAALMGYRVEAGQLIVGPVTVGAGAYVGLRAVLEPGSAVSDGAILDDLSLLPAVTTIPPGAAWLGSPAEPTGQRRYGFVPQPYTEPNARFSLALMGALVLMLLLPALALLPESFLYANYIRHWSVGAQFAMLWPLTVLYIGLLLVLLVAVKRGLVGRLPEGRFQLDSLMYVRHWLAEAVVSVSLSQLKSIYATIYTPAWMRLLGVRVGRRAEISTVNHVSTDHLTLGDGVFLADSVSIGAARVQDGYLTLQQTSIGNRSFVGNSAVLGGGTVVGSGCLVGALSTTPPGGCPDGTDWVGSPALRLPARPVKKSFSDALTYAPSHRLIWLRGSIELLKITLPTLFVAFNSAMLLVLLRWLPDTVSTIRFLWLGTATLLGTAIGLSLLTVGLKWLLIGRYRPSEKPLWNSFVWRNDLVNSLCENYVYPYLAGFLLGTPLATWFFRAMGSHFGKNVYLETTEMTEFDLVHVGPGASLNASCTIQTHLFEDRIMKMSGLKVGAGATVGVSSVVLYDTVIEPGARLRGLSLLMKGETLPARTIWQGIPSTPA